jgi:hypothetical protein
MKIKIGYMKHPPRVLLKRYIAGMASAYIAKFVYLWVFIRPKQKRIVLMGHRLNNNLKPFAEWLAHNQKGFEVVFFTDDPDYYSKTKNKNNIIPFYSMQNPWHLRLAAYASVICTSHGPVFFKAWKNHKHRPLFIELRHGAGLKVPNAEPQGLFYDAMFISSLIFKEHSMSIGYREDQLYLTGLAQSDALYATPRESKLQEIREEAGVGSEFKKVILFAPTWRPNNQENVATLSTTLEDFLNKICAVAEKHNAILLMLPHPNSTLELPAEKHNLKYISSATGLDLKTLLHIVDVLITDWSSIHVDFLALPELKPAIFLDKDPDLDGWHGCIIPPEERQGAIVSNMDEFIYNLELSIKRPEEYTNIHKEKALNTRKKLWGNTLDGKSSERYYKTICKLLESKNSE